MEDALITLLATFKYPVIRQGSLAPGQAYPDTFFTFWNNSADGDDFYDNVETVTKWDFDLNIYSSDPTVVNSLLLEAKALLKAEGFIVSGKGYDVISDEETHTGRGINIVYIEREEIEA